jgi:hypothetical protein
LPHTIELVNSWTPEMLPFGRTCFFTLKVPPYDSKAVFKQKLLYALENCKQIDGDFERTGIHEEAANENLNLEDGHDSDSEDHPRRRRVEGIPDEEDSYGREEMEEL